MDNDDDGGLQWWAELGQQQEQEEWLADRAAQAEYQSWLDVLNALAAKEAE